jgi:hypothetical protein
MLGLVETISERVRIRWKPQTSLPPFGHLRVGLVRIQLRLQSSTTIAGWPLLHVCGGIDPATMQPRVARGVIAIGNIAVGVLAIGGVACGLITVGGASLGLLLAIGGAAFGAGCRSAASRSDQSPSAAPPLVSSTRSAASASDRR